MNSQQTESIKVHDIFQKYRVTWIRNMKEMEYSKEARKKGKDQP